MPRKTKSQRKPHPVTPRPTVKLKPSRYQPSKAEMGKVFRLDGTPEQAAKAIGKQVKIVRED